MQEEIYNPDNIYIKEEVKNPKKGKNKKESNDTSFFKSIRNFFTNTRTRMLIGSIIGLIGLLLIISFFSFINNGGYDQSLIESKGSIELANSTEEINNITGTLGAHVSNLLITEGIGYGAFIFATWILIIGISIFGVKKIKFFSTTLICFLLTICTSLILGLLTLNVDSFILYGGSFGKCASLFLVRFVGYLGTIAIYVVLVFTLILLCYNTISKALKKAKELIPKNLIRQTKIEELEDNKPEEEVNKDEQEQKQQQPIDLLNLDENPESQDSGIKVNEDITSPIEEEIEDDPNDKYKPKDTDYIINDNPEVEEEDKTSDELIIKSANPIEKASSSDKVEILDPTSELSRYKFPPISLLNKIEIKTNNIDVEEQESNKKTIIDTLKSYNIPIKSIEACVGPTVTLFEIIPDDGVRISKIKNLENDIALQLSALGIRIIAPIPGRGTIGIEVPNHDPQIVSMRSVIESKKFQETKCELPMAIGCTISNEVFIADLCKMPHILVAGATGQGKSVGLNAIITSLLYHKHPAELKFVLIDPKMVEFSLYSKLEHHYLAKLPDEEDAIITDPMKVITTLNSLAIEMDNRYALLRNARARNIKEYNTKYVNRVLNPEKGHKYLPYIVVIIDEFCDLIMMAGKEVEMPIARIAQKARAVGIHMIIATQRPSTNVITGIIKANFPGRIAFRVTQMVDSRTILDCSGAQQLIGRGDMLFYDGGNLERIQCAFVDTPEIEAICDHIDNQIGYEEAYQLPEYIAEETPASGMRSMSDRDPLFDEAALFIIGGQTASTSSLQRHFSIGYNRAGKIMDQMQDAGIVGPAQGGKPRQVLMDSIQLSQLINKDEK